MTTKCLGVIGFAMLGASCYAQLTPVEYKGLDDALFIGNLSSKDLSFQRLFRSDDYRFELAEQCISDPIAGSERLMKMHVSAGPKIGQMLRLALSVYPDVNPKALVQDELGDAEAPEAVPIEYREAIRSLAKAVSRASMTVRSGLESLTLDERRDIIESLPRLIATDFDPKFDFAHRPELLHAKLFELLGKVDFGKIRIAALDLADAVDDHAARFQRIARTSPFIGYAKFTVGRLTCVFAGQARNEHEDRDAALTIDLGGDDVYRGRHGAGVGYASVLIDLAGNDTYEGPDLNIGAGALGVGIAVDLGGDDVVRGSSIGFGSGIAGIGVFLNDGGADKYDSTCMSQGFGTFGVGLCIDTAGNDQYSCPTLGQGSAFVQGVGWLADLTGDDVFRAMGQGTSKEAWSQGSAKGIAGDAAGGIGLITDLGGDDFYLSSRSSQAIGCDFGVGTLYDAKGIDTYNASGESQSAGLHGGAAYLFEVEGRDTYTLSDFGSQSTAFDFGLAFFIDRAGNDLYASRTSRPGVALSSSLSLFLDSDGQDRYGSAPLIVSGRIGAALSLFVDLNGPDVYANGLEDGGAGLNSNGVTIDLETHGTSANALQSKPSRPKAGSIPAKPAVQLSEIFQRAVAGAADSEKAIDELVGMGAPAFEWMLSTQLSTLTNAEISVFIEMIDAIGVDARNQIGFKVGDKSDLIAFNALRICYEGQIKEGGPMIVQALGREKLILLAAKAAGKLSAAVAAPDLMALCARKDTALILSALESLAELKDTTSVGTGQALLESTDLLIRRAAIRVVVNSPGSAIASGKLFIRDVDERKARIGCEILSALGSAESLKELGSALDDPRSGVRLQAAIGLAGRCPLDKRPSFMAVKRDPNPLVRMATANLDPGR